MLAIVKQRVKIAKEEQEFERKMERDNNTGNSDLLYRTLKDMKKDKTSKLKCI